MQTFNLTPAVKKIPTAWGNSTPILQTSDQDTRNIESLRELEQHYRSLVRLDSINIHANKWPSETLEKIYRASYPLLDLFNNRLESKLSVKVTPAWLLYWEVYARCYRGWFVSQLKRKVEGFNATRTGKTAVNPRPIPLRTVHLLAGATVETLQKVVLAAEREAGINVTWSWLGTGGTEIECAKYKTNWLLPIDGDGMSVANMRAYKNRISATTKVTNVIVSDDSDESNTANIIAFALVNLAAEGSAIIKIPRISAASVVAMIHLFAQCFEESGIIHTQAKDCMFMFGNGFLNNLTTKHIKLLYAFCELDPGHTNQCPFTLEYTQSAEFGATMAQIMVVNAEVQRWRYEYYEKMLILNTQIVKSTAADTFDNYLEDFLEESYRDQSVRWVAATKFNFFEDA